MVKALRFILALPFLILLYGYRFLISPVIHTLVPGSGCRFEPSCSRYALDAFRHLPLHRAFWLSLCRVCRCHPWSEGGYDPVPDVAVEDHTDVSEG